MRLWCALLIVVAGCQNSASPSAPGAPRSELDRAAIEAGVIPDPRADIAGFYARGGDRVCIVNDAGRYRIGAVMEIDRDLRCEGSGTVRRDGALLNIRFDGVERCRISARYDGDRISFAGTVPAECAALCTQRASFSAMEVVRLGQAEVEVSKPRRPDGKSLCPA